MIRRLHFGCGVITPYGWVNSDIQKHPGVDVVADIRAGLPFGDNEFDCIVGMHVLPEIPYPALDSVLRELRRILRPTGVLRLGLPDMDKAIKAYLSNDVDYFLVPDDHVTTAAGKMIVQLTWYGMCRCMFTESFATELLQRNGFSRIDSCAFRQTKSPHAGIVELDNRELESIYLEAYK